MGNRVLKSERILTHCETSLENSERPESRKGERSKRRQRPINNVHFPPRPLEPDGQGGKIAPFNTHTPTNFGKSSRKAKVVLEGCVS